MSSWTRRSSRRAFCSFLSPVVHFPDDTWLMILIRGSWEKNFRYNDLLFKIAVRSDMLCILVAGLLDAFVTAYSLQGTNSGPGLNFRELTYGRIKMMTALCPAFSHTFQTMRLANLIRSCLKPSGCPNQGFFYHVTMFPDSAISPPILMSCSSHTEACNIRNHRWSYLSLLTTCTLTTARTP